MCASLSLSLSLYIYSLSLSIYIYIERERERETSTCSGSSFTYTSFPGLSREFAGLGGGERDLAGGARGPEVYAKNQRCSVVWVLSRKDYGVASWQLRVKMVLEFGSL